MKCVRFLSYPLAWSALGFPPSLRGRDKELVNRRSTNVGELWKAPARTARSAADALRNAFRMDPGALLPDQGHSENKLRGTRRSPTAPCQLPRRHRLPYQLLLEFPAEPLQPQFRVRPLFAITVARLRELLLPAVRRPRRHPKAPSARQQR